MTDGKPPTPTSMDFWSRSSVSSVPSVAQGARDFRSRHGRRRARRDPRAAIARRQRDGTRTQQRTHRVDRGIAGRAHRSVATGAGLLGRAGECDAARQRRGARRVAAPGRAVRWPARLRPDVRAVRVTAAARGAARRLPDARRAADARRAGRAAVRVVDGPAACGWSHARAVSARGQAYGHIHTDSRCTSRRSRSSRSWHSGGRSSPSTRRSSRIC